ncbi:MAG TPA: glycosyltransferase [Allosphingosinicella sp.]|jgi:glycosyltransferase involved in cell wall biosynthesis
MRAPPPDARPAVAVFRAPLFNPSETFVRAHLAALRRYRPLAVGLVAKGETDARRLLPASARERLALTLFGRAEALAGRLRPENPALVHAHFGTDGLLALPLAEALGVPLVTTLHGHEVSRAPARLLLSGRLTWMRYALVGRRLRERGRLFLAVSDAVRKRALDAGYPPERTIIHYNGVDTSVFRPSGAAPEPGLILHVGRLVEKKGTRDLIDAVAGIDGAILVVVGDGPSRRALERRARALGAAVRFAGALPPVEVLGWMRRAWLLAAPSVTARDGDAEGLPTVICEAAAAGLPVVATRHSGIPEAVLDGETGLLSAEGDVAALARNLSFLLASPDMREAMSAAGRRLARERFDLEAQTARLERHYDSVVGRSSA